MTAVCRVPQCGKPALLYPAGFLCEDHEPSNHPSTEGEPS